MRPKMRAYRTLALIFESLATPETKKAPKGAGVNQGFRKQQASGCGFQSIANVV